MRKKLIGSLIVTSLTVFATACGTSTPSGSGDSNAKAEESYVMKFHHDLATDSPQHLAAEKFEEIVEEKTDGRVDVKLYPSNQLGEDEEVVEMMQTGSIEAGIIPTAKLATFDARMQLPDLPFIFPSKEVAYEVLDGEVGQELLGGLSEIGLQGATFWESGFKQFTNNKRIEKPEDFGGLKIRTMESPIVIEQFKALRANPVPISFSETYNALQQGVVSGQENPLVSIVKMKFFEVQDYTIISNHGYLAYAFLMSKDWFDGLPDDIQTIIIDSAKETALYEREETATQEEDFIQTIKDSGTEVYELTPEQKQAFQDQTKSVHDKFTDEIGQDLLDKTYEIVNNSAE